MACYLPHSRYKKVSILTKEFLFFFLFTKWRYVCTPADHYPLMHELTCVKNMFKALLHLPSTFHEQDSVTQIFDVLASDILVKTPFYIWVQATFDTLLPKHFGTAFWLSCHRREDILAPILDPLGTSWTECVPVRVKSANWFKHLC